MGENKKRSTQMDIIQFGTNVIVRGATQFRQPYD